MPSVLNDSNITFHKLPMSACHRPTYIKRKNMHSIKTHLATTDGGVTSVLLCSDGCSESVGTAESSLYQHMCCV